ncbi:MAG: hypothetical protein M3123_07565 [Actinomycetota bacterium]|nr:hypothetical protein [Actinomycetota bacterium]
MRARAERRGRTQEVLSPPSPAERAVVRERAKRRARLEHERERKRARARFFVLLGALVFVALVLSLTIWDQIQALFGL